MDIETLKETADFAGHFIAPDHWAVGAILTTDDDGVNRLQGQTGNYAIHSVKVTGRKINRYRWETDSVRVRVTFWDDNLDGPANSLVAWMRTVPSTK